MIIQRDSLTFRGIACPWAVLLYPIYELVKQFLLSVPDDQLADNVSPFICLNIADIGRYPVAIAIRFIPAFTGNEYGLARKIVDANIFEGQFLFSFFVLIHPHHFPVKVSGFPRGAPA